MVLLCLPDVSSSDSLVKPVCSNRSLVGCPKIFVISGGGEGYCTLRRFRAPLQQPSAAIVRLQAVQLERLVNLRFVVKVVMNALVVVIPDHDVSYAIRSEPQHQYHSFVMTPALTNKH